MKKILLGIVAALAVALAAPPLMAQAPQPEPAYKASSSQVDQDQVYRVRAVYHELEAIDVMNVKVVEKAAGKKKNGATTDERKAARAELTPYPLRL